MAPSSSGVSRPTIPPATLAPETPAGTSATTPAPQSSQPTGFSTLSTFQPPAQTTPGQTHQVTPNVTAQLTDRTATVNANVTTTDHRADAGGNTSDRTTTIGGQATYTFPQRADGRTPATPANLEATLRADDHLTTDTHRPDGTRVQTDERTTGNLSISDTQNPQGPTVQAGLSGASSRTETQPNGRSETTARTGQLSVTASPTNVGGSAEVTTRHTQTESDRSTTTNSGVRLNLQVNPQTGSVGAGVRLNAGQSVTTGTTTRTNSTQLELQVQRNRLNPGVAPAQNQTTLTGTLTLGSGVSDTATQASEQRRQVLTGRLSTGAQGTSGALSYSNHTEFNTPAAGRSGSSDLSIGGTFNVPRAQPGQTAAPVTAGLTARYAQTDTRPEAGGRRTTTLNANAGLQYTGPRPGNAAAGTPGTAASLRLDVGGSYSNMLTRRDGTTTGYEVHGNLSAPLTGGGTVTGNIGGSVTTGNGWRVGADAYLNAQGGTALVGTATRQVNPNLDLQLRAGIGAGQGAAPAADGTVSTDGASGFNVGVRATLHF